MDGVHVEECVPLVLPLAESLRVAVAQALCVVLPHCEKDGVPLADTLNVGVKLAETLVVPQWLPVSEEEGVAVHEGVPVPLKLPLEENDREDVAHPLRVALAHCEREGVKLDVTQGEGVELADSEALLHCEREGVKLVEPQSEPLALVVTEVEKEGENVGESVPLELLLVVALSDAVAQALCVALPH